MARLLTLVALGLSSVFAAAVPSLARERPGRPERACARRSASLRRLLLRRAALLAQSHPGVEAYVGKVSLPEADLPVYRSRPLGRCLKVVSPARVLLGHRQKPSSAAPAALQRALEPAIPVSYPPAQIDLDRWGPTIRKAFDRGSELDLDSGIAVAIDARISAATVVDIFSTIARAGWADLDLLARLGHPRVLSGGRPHPTATASSAAKYWPGWICQGPPAEQCAAAEKTLRLTPWRLRPLVFSELAAEAQRRSRCSIDPQQIVWLQQSLFPAPRYGAARVSLQRDNSIHYLITLDQNASWQASLRRVIRRLGAALRPSPGRRVPVWFASGSRFRVVRTIPKAWTLIPYYDRTDKGKRALAEVRTRHGRIAACTKARATILGSFPRSVLRRWIRASRARLSSCLTHALSRRSGLDGVLELQFFILPGTGKVHALKVLSSSVHHREVERCIDNAFKTLVFPAPRSGMTMIRLPVCVHLGRRGAT